VNTLIIGFGKRAKFSILPALKIINEGKIFVYSNNLEKLKTHQQKYNFELFTLFEKESFINISKIFICTPCENFLPLVQKLSQLKLTWVTLFIDTPIIPKMHNFEIEHYKNEFKEILVTEDCFYNPINKIIRNVIKANNLGKIKKINFVNYGHTYHALAHSRKLLKDKFIHYGIKYKNKYKFILSNSEINIIGGRMDSGYMHIFFKEEVISINDYNDKNDTSYKIKYLFNNDLLSGYLINNKKVNLTDDLIKNFIKLEHVCKIYNIHGIHFQEKIISLVYLILNTKNDNKKKYLLSDGIYDSFTIAVTKKIKVFFDLIFINKSLLIRIFYKIYLIKKFFK